MTSLNTDIGSGDNITTTEIQLIENEFREEHLPQQAREEYIQQKFESKDKIRKYPVILVLEKVTICIGINFDIVLKNTYEEHMKEVFEKNVFVRLEKIFPERNLRLNTYHPSQDFQRINKPKEDESRKKNYNKIKITIIGAIIGGTTIALVSFFLNSILQLQTH